ncbi:DUF7344 domain-containing protein [Haloarcula salina]|uniref:DUF7344 domain-containing protein n=1 Tax=Haloarcula salina TaxID=1429914 RepID=UPI003C701E45
MGNQARGSPKSEQWQGMTPDNRDLSATAIDDVFQVLSDWRRRAVCLHFATRDGNGTDVETLAAAVAERGSRASAADGDVSPSTVQTQLETEHLPTLHRIGLLDYDERSGAVRYWGSPTVEKWAEHAAAVTRRDEF